MAKTATKTMTTKTTTAEVAVLIAQVCGEVRDLLLSKNAAYGNSAIEPIRIFSKADSVEQLLVRLDDKLSRIARGSSAGEDVEWDLLGYLVLLRVARRLNKEKDTCSAKRRSSPRRRKTRTRGTEPDRGARTRPRKAGSAGRTRSRSRGDSRPSKR